ncbi:MAG: 2-hydroxyacid dehydrogenase [Sphaerospermopsis sp. SIO1G2]|nr:2-hydroxyacid dehydrogenase [Sphaerospermopsis sp. SIO1G2]
MDIAFFSTKPYDRASFETENQQNNQKFMFYEARLTPTTVSLAAGFPVVCAFINDQLDRDVLQSLANKGTKLLAMRCAGYNNVDLEAAAEYGIKVVRVPAYSPYAVAEHAVGLILMLNRKLYRAYNRVRDDNFAINGLLGFDIHGTTVGVVGTGKIGQCFAQIMHGFGCNLIGYDVYENPECLSLGLRYVEMPELLSLSDIVSLHCPLSPSTYHLINEKSIQQMKPGMMVINTSRGGLIDTNAAIKGLKSKQIGYLGIDVYEQEADIFFEDLSDEVIQDDTFQRLQSFPNVVITAHQAFFTRNALKAIAQITLSNIADFEAGRPCPNEIKTLS